MTALNSQLIMENLTFERNYQTLFSDISFTLNPGELLQVVGANGCGKSTLLRILAGYLEPEAGQILWQNQSITKQRATYQQDIHYLGHRNAIKTLLTAQENLQLYAALNQIKNCDYEAVLHKVGLHRDTRKPVTELSQGQSRRLALARLLMKPSAIWILDEPNAGLDEQGQKLLFDLYKHHRDNGGIIITATHQPISSASKTCSPGSKNQNLKSGTSLYV